jgi:elongation factor G
MLYDERIITKKPISGESFLDSDPTESSRHSSVFSHFARVPHKSHLLEVTDTPWGDFPSDALAALDGADSAVIVVSAADGVQSGTIHAYEHCQANGIKTMIALSKMDRAFVSADQVIANLEEILGMKPIPLQIPQGEGDTFSGVKSLFFLDEEGNPSKNNDADLKDAWMALEEAVAMTDDELLVEYLENGELAIDKVFDGLRSGVRQGKILPLVYTSAEKDLGVSDLMDSIIAALPDPVEMREDALRVACESDQGKCGLQPGVEAGFAARVLHTMIDSFGSISVLRIISNSRSSDTFHSLPNEAVVLRTGEKVKMPSASTCFGLNGKVRLPLADGSSMIPGDVIALPKLSDAVQTNDILILPSALHEEETEIKIETSASAFTPLSRVPEQIPLMTSATVSVVDAGNKSKAKGAGADEKLSSALKAMAREDLAIRVEHDTSGKLLLRCMSGDHLQIIAERLRERYALDVEFGRPSVQYRETLVKAVKNIEGRHKKQSGGSGQFGVCFIDMEPLDEGCGIEFVSKIKGGVISKPFISSVEKGVREQLQSGGPLAGYPVTDVRVTLVDGKMHSVDSKDIAFQSAGKLAVQAALEKGKTRLLQPMEKVTFTIHESIQGEINTIVSRGDGYVTATNPSSENAHLDVDAIIPASSIGVVSDVLRAASGGEASFVSTFSHYEPVSDSKIDEIIQNGPRAQRLDPSQKVVSPG